MRIERFEDIDPPAVWRIAAWQLARELTHKVYGLTKKAKFARDLGSEVQGSEVQACPPSRACARSGEAGGVAFLLLTFTNPKP